MSGTYMAISAVGVGFIVLIYLLIAPSPTTKRQPQLPQQKNKKKK